MAKKKQAKKASSKVDSKKRLHAQAKHYPKAFLELMRVGNCLMAAVAIIIGFFIAGGLIYTTALIAAISGFFICAGGQTINDYFDRKIDAITSKNRPIPSGRVSPKQALFFSLALFIIGIGLATQLNITGQFIAILFTVLLIAYPLFMNRVKYIGNIIVAAGTAFTFIYGAAATGQVPTLIIALAISAFFSNMAREIIKDIEDMKKDNKTKTTIPLLIGSQNAKAFPLIYYTIAILLSVFLFFRYRLNEGYLFITLIGAIFFIYSAIFLLKNNPKKSQKMSKIGMIISLIAFILAGF